jgi:uncharacterized protein
MTTALKLLAGVLALYLLLTAALWLMQRSMIYFPFGGRPEPAMWGAAGMTAVDLPTGDGLSLLAWWRPPARNGAPVLVLFHGNAGHLGYRAGKVRDFLDAGWGVLLPAYRGYSGNPGRPTEAGLYADGRAALDWLAAQGVAPGHLVLYGESLGSGVAVKMASERRVGAVVLEAPFTSLAELAAHHYPIFPARWLLRDRYESVVRIGEVTAPVLVIHGERDAIVPASFGRALLAAANEPKHGVFLSGAGHNDLSYHGIAGHVLDFVASHMGAAPDSVR